MLLKAAADYDAPQQRSCEKGGGGGEGGGGVGSSMLWASGFTKTQGLGFRVHAYFRDFGYTPSLLVRVQGWASIHYIAGFLAESAQRPNQKASW